MWPSLCPKYASEGFFVWLGSFVCLFVWWGSILGGFLLVLLLLLFRFFAFFVFFFFKNFLFSTLYSSCPKCLRLKETFGGGALAQWSENLDFSPALNDVALKTFPPFLHCFFKT